jgi:hypothetical protein
MTDYKQLCADLLAWSEKTSSHYYSQPGVIIRARAALAEPEPEGPTDEEIMELMPQQMRDDLAAARWGNHPESPDSSTQPIPVIERLPGPDDCNSKGECWWLHPGDEDCGAFWTLFDGRYRVGCTHWLPAHALPQPS